MVEEMLLKREGKKFRSEGLSLRYNTNPGYTNLNTTLSEPTSDNENRDWNYQRRDGSSVTGDAFKQPKEDATRRLESSAVSTNGQVPSWFHLLLS